MSAENSSKLALLVSEKDRPAVTRHLYESLQPAWLNTYCQFRWTSSEQDRVAVEQVGEGERVVRYTEFDANPSVVAYLTDIHVIDVERRFFTKRSPYPLMLETEGMTTALGQVHHLLNLIDRVAFNQHLLETHPSQPNMLASYGLFRWIDEDRRELAIEQIANPKQDVKGLGGLVTA